MAAAAITFGASGILAILKPMADRAGNELLDHLDKMINIKKEIVNLKGRLHLIQRVIQDAEEKQIEDNHISDWLRQVIDISYEARDVLDDFFTYLSLERDKKASKSVKSKFLPSLFKSGSSSSTIPFKKKSPLASDIISVNKKLDELTRQCDIFSKLKSVVGSSGSETVPIRQRPDTGPFQNKQRALFVGRDAVKEDIMLKVLDHTNNDVQLIPIWGMGGIGKTTLAQSIFNDDRVKQEDYPKEKKRWLFAGKEKINAVDIIARIIDPSKKENYKESDLAYIQEKLVKMFNGDKFLIVLDDVWDVERSGWESLWEPLTSVRKGGVIIMTTRDKKCIMATNSPVPDPIKSLSDEDCWLIFKSYAYNNTDPDNNKDEKLKIGQHIVRKLKGLPLAAKVVGSSLFYEPDVSTWRKFRDSPLRKLNEKEDDVMSVLRWSYNRLPSHLKQCFSYCALFPKDHEFHEKELVKMWMAHDIIPKEAQGEEQPEDIGAQYFKELVNTSFFQQTINGKYVMHDMIHDLALHVSGEDFITLSRDSSPDQMEDKVIRHLTIIERGTIVREPFLCKTKGILTLYTEYYSIINLELDVFLKQFKSIRVLVLHSYGIRKIPDCIKELKHLRYLDVIDTKVQLSDSVCELYNLQTLAVFEDYALPKGVVNMKNLRHLRGTLDTCKGLGKLTSLQELSAIRVRKGDSISELGDLLKLRGKLKIEGLENVMSSDDAAQAKMQKKEHIENLSLLSSFPGFSKDILEALKIPPNLKSLEIDGYTGDTFPSWFTNAADYSNKYLSSLTIRNCNRVEFLELDAFLSIKHLEIASCSNLKSIRLSKYGASTIEVLEIRYCDKFTKMDIQSLPTLRYFKLQNCNVIRYFCAHICFCAQKDASQANIQKKIHIEDLSLRLSSDYGNFEKSTMIEDVLEAFNCPSPNLKSLRIYDYNGDTLPHWLTNGADYLKRCLSGLYIENCDKVELLQLDAFVCLQNLWVHDCSNLKRIRLAKEVAATIEDLHIWRCPELREMENESLPSLRELRISECDKLVSFPACLVKTEEMTVEYCAELSSLMFSFGGIISLRYLLISECPMLKQFSIVEEGSTSSSSTSPSTTVLSLPPNERISLYTQKFEPDAQGRLVLITHSSPEAYNQRAMCATSKAYPFS